MTFRSSATLALASAALLVACGGRSQLSDSGAAAAGSGGEGGGGNGGNGGNGPSPSSVSVSVSSTGTGIGGSGGAGGSTGLCVVDGQPIGLAGTEGYNLSNPVLIAPEKKELATLIAGWTADKGSPLTPTELRHASFEAWGPWPADGTIGPSYLADYDGGERFAAAPAIGGFSLFFAGKSPSPHLTYLSPLTPGSGKIPGSFQLGAALAEPLFVTQSAKADIHLMGFAGSVVVPHDFNLIQQTDSSSSPIVTFGLGCASVPITAAGAPAFGGSLIAFSSGAAFFDPGCQSGGIMHAATHVLVARVDDKATFIPLAEIGNSPGEGSIAAVKVVPSGDHVWIVWAHESGSSAPLRLARMDATGAITSGILEVPLSIDPATISAARLGDRLALAWTSSAPDGLAIIHVSVLDGSGVVTETAISRDKIATGRTALLGSPSGDSLLVSWSEGVFSSRRVLVARLACSLP
jgi:hypothetical protein